MGVCLLLASKFCQPCPLSLALLVSYTDSSVSLEELREWELMVLTSLNWELSSPTSVSFLQQFTARLRKTSHNNTSSNITRLAEALIVRAETEYQFILTNRSLLAAAALATSVQIQVEEEREAKDVEEEIVQMSSHTSEHVQVMKSHLRNLLNLSMLHKSNEDRFSPDYSMKVTKEY